MPFRTPVCVREIVRLIILIRKHFSSSVRLNNKIMPTQVPNIVVSTVSSLDEFPELIIVKIFGFCAVGTLLRCYRTCKKFNAILNNDDEAWNRGSTRYDNVGKPKALTDARLQTHRFYSCVEHALRMVRWEQRQTESILCDCLHDHVDILELIREFPIYGGRRLHYLERVYMRGDAVMALVELVEANVIHILRQSNTSYLSFRENNDSVYPEFKAKHLYFTLRQLDIVDLKNRSIIHEPGSADILEDHVKDRIVLRLCRRAGIVKMANDVFAAVWKSLVHAICSVLHRTKQYMYRRNEPQRILPGESIWSVPSANVVNAVNGSRLYVLIPRHVENAFEVNNYPIYRVYMYHKHWYIPDDGSVDVSDDAARMMAIDAEQEEAMLLYRQVHDDSDSDSDSDSNSSTISDITEDDI